MIRKKLQSAARGDVKGNYANKFRQNRINIFLDLIKPEGNTAINILDIGGTDYHWTNLNINNGLKLNITLLNKSEVRVKNPGFEYVRGDGRDLSLFDDNSIDIVYSNSVIEHVGEFEDQKKFAGEVRRISKRYFIQTPNYYFPFEPHFLMFGIHYLPVKYRAFLIRHLNMGWYEKKQNYSDSIKLAKSLRLLKRKELEYLFPGANIISERFYGLNKSFMLYKGFSKK